MKCKFKFKFKYALILIGLIGLTKLIYYMNELYTVDNFYKSLENSMLNKVEEVKYNIENDNLIDVEFISRGPLEKSSYRVDPGQTFYSKRLKDTIVNYGEKYETYYRYNVLANVTNNSKYDLNLMGDYGSYDTLKSGESIKTDCYLNEYRNDDLMFYKIIVVYDKIKFNFKNRDIEFPVKIELWLNAYGDNNTINKVEIHPNQIILNYYDDDSGSIGSYSDKHDEKIKQEIGIILGRDNDINHYIQSTDLFVYDLYDN